MLNVGGRGWALAARISGAAPAPCSAPSRQQEGRAGAQPDWFGREAEWNQKRWDFLEPQPAKEWALNL